MKCAIFSEAASQWPSICNSSYMWLLTDPQATVRLGTQRFLSRLSCNTIEKDGDNNDDDEDDD